MIWLRLEFVLVESHFWRNVWNKARKASRTKNVSALKNSFAILDEAQNATDTQIKMFLTRIGENSKIVVNGDPSQIDLPNKSMSGLDRSKKLLSHLNEITVIDFDHSDVVRHPLVSKIVKAYSNHND